MIFFTTLVPQYISTNMWNKQIGDQYKEIYIFFPTNILYQCTHIKIKWYIDEIYFYLLSLKLIV